MFGSFGAIDVEVGWTDCVRAMDVIDDAATSATNAPRKSFGVSMFARITSSVFSNHTPRKRLCFSHVRPKSETPSRAIRRGRRKCFVRCFVTKNTKFTKLSYLFVTFVDHFKKFYSAAASRAFFKFSCSLLYVASLISPLARRISRFNNAF